MAEPMEESSLEAQLAAAVQENQAFRASQQELADRHASEMAEVRGQMAALVSQAAAQAEHFQAQMAHAQQAGAVPQVPVAPVDQPQPPPRSDSSGHMAPQAKQTRHLLWEGVRTGQGMALSNGAILRTV